MCPRTCSNTSRTVNWKSAIQTGFSLIALLLNSKYIMSSDWGVTNALQLFPIGVSLSFLEAVILLVDLQMLHMVRKYKSEAYKVRLL